MAIMELLLSGCPDNDSRKRLFQNSEEETLLQTVAEGYNTCDIARWLLDNCPEEIRAGMFKEDILGRTPLHNAIRNNDFNLAVLLIRNFNRKIKERLSVPDKKGHTLLDYTLIYGDAKIKEYFLSAFYTEAGMERLFGPDKYESILRTAITQSSDDNVLWLLNKCPDEWKNKVFRRDSIDRLFRLSVEENRVGTAVYLCNFNPEFTRLLDESIDNWLTNPFLCLSNLKHLCALPGDDFKPLKLLSDKYEKTGEEDRKIIDLVFYRAQERNPGFARGAVEFPGIFDFIDELIALNHEMGSKDSGYVCNMLEREFKMNQNLPMNAETVRTISSLFRSLREDGNLEFRLHLALQTHEDFEEVKQLFADPDFIKEELPEKDKFFKLSFREQIGFIRRSQIFRDYRAIPQANRILKETSAGQSFDEELIEQSLKLLINTEVEGSENNRERLLKIASSKEFAPEIRQLAIRAFAGVGLSPQNRANRESLRSLLSSTEEPLIQTAILDALGAYEFFAEDKETIDYLVEFSRNAEDETVKRSCAFLLSVIPREDALKEALSIINGPIWDSVDFGEKAVKRGNTYLFIYRPSFHDNRNSMRKIIAERLVLLHREGLETQIREILKDYRLHRNSYPSLKNVEESITSIPDYVRYVPFQLFFPENKCFFRGFKAGSLGQFDSFLMKGSGSYNLWLFDLDNNPLWAQIGQVFMSATSDYVMGNYFKSDGILITIDSNYVNEALLRRNIRLQKDGSIHPVSYKKIVHDFISGIFVARSGPPAEKVASLTEHKISAKIPRTTKLNALEKIQKRRLLGTDRRGKSLKDRVFYFDPKGDLKSQVKNIMKGQGLEEMSMEEIVEENLQRRVVREILADTLKDPELRECMRAALD